MNNIVLFYNNVPVLIYYDTFHQRHRVTRKVQLRGIGIRRNGGGLVSLAIYCFGYKITNKETALQENLCTHLVGVPNVCVKKTKNAVITLRTVPTFLQTGRFFYITDAKRNKGTGYFLTSAMRHPVRVCAF